MDGDRFDRLARTLTAPLSRRVTLGGLAAGVLVALGLALEETTVLGKKKKNNNKGKGNNKNNKKKDCPKGRVRCGGTCCQAGEGCVGGQCTHHCRDGQRNFGETDTDCGGTCVPDKRCGIGQLCAVDADCDTGVCELVEDFNPQQKVCGACRIDSDCAAGTGAPRCVEHRCVACAADFDCPAERPFCVAAPACPNNEPCACHQCRQDGDCPRPGQPAEHKFCVEPFSGECPANQPCVCRECRDSGDCAEGEFCDEQDRCFGTCAAGQNICQGSTFACNGDSLCYCLLSTSQTTVCLGLGLGGACSPCVDDSDCDAVGRPGWNCVDYSGPACFGVCAHTNNRACISPCPTSP